MKEIVTIIFALLFLALDLSLIVSVKRLIKAGSKIQGAAAAVCYGIFGVVAVFACGIGSEGMYQSMKKTALFPYIKTNFLSVSNPQVLYFLFYILMINFAVCIAGLLIWWFILLMSKLTCVQNAAIYIKEKMRKRPFTTILGKWLWNLSSAMLVLFFIQIVCGLIAVYVKIPEFSYIRKTQWLYGFFRLTFLISLVMAGVGRALSYDVKWSLEQGAPQESATQKAEKKQASYERLLLGVNLRVASGSDLKMVLPDYLYECFQRRHRVVFLCRGKEEKLHWQMTLTDMLTGRFGEICLIRIGEAMHLKNREDIDILVADADEFLHTNLQQIWPQWFFQVGFVILSDSHRFLADTTQADAFFALWRQMASQDFSQRSSKSSIQYLFLDCTMSAQEKEALVYYAGGDVEDQADWEKEASNEESRELVPWLVVSQAGLYRRLLLLMKAENGVPESWLIRQKKRFGMEHASTEEFLKNVLSAVLPDYPVQNIYDIFSFEEEPAWPHGKWKVRLSDAAAEAILTRRDTEKKLISTRPGMIRLPDIVYEMEDAEPLGSKLKQNNWSMQLCEAKIKRICRGFYFLAETKSLSDYDHMIHEEYEEKSVFRQPDQYETVFLQLTIMCSESSEKKQLAQLLASVCNEVLSTIFPYNKGQITACYRDEDSFLGIVPFIRYSQTTENMYQDAFVIDLIENQSEEGLAAALYKNSSLLFIKCREWLRRAVDDPKSNEAALVDYMMKAQQTQLMLPAASESAGQLAGLAKLLLGLLSE